MRLLSPCLVALLVLSGCKVKEDGLVILATAEDAALLKAGIDFMGDERVKLKEVADPAAELANREGVVVAVTDGDACDECYRLGGSGTLLEARGGGVLGRQYALWHALEVLGYRFPHPRYTKKPDTFANTDPGALNKDFTPDIEKRRGLHLHTLHPIETLYDTWLAGPENLDGALRMVDFVIKNRGDYVQWCALDDILKDPTLVPGWKAHTKAITDFAHARGVKTGVALQLFGQANLQNAFDLIDDLEADPVPEMERRLRVLLDDTGFDAMNLSFGEFFGADPEKFVQEVDVAYAAMQRVQPGVEVMATIHVGNYDNLRIEFRGVRQLYYFLVQYTNPAIVHWVHTTMFYNLYEPTGRAYLHDQFDEHRDYLEARLRENKPVGYFPESAYWVAFDINIPVTMPVYMRSRHLDLVRLAQVGQLQDHVLFSSGWEWGYWLTDATTLRMNYQRPEKWDDPVKHIFAAWGEQGATAAELIRQLAEAQHRAFILEKLTAYIASRDQIIDAGDNLGIFSQPDRPEFDELAAATPEVRAAFKADVVDKLKVHADEVTAIAEASKALPANDPVFAELKDSLEVTAARTRFIHSLFAAALVYAETGNDGGHLARADADLAAGKEIVARRRRALWDPDPKTILRNTPNPTFYQYGYLREGDTLCFWERERAQAKNLIEHAGLMIPGCVL